MPGAFVTEAVVDVARVRGTKLTVRAYAASGCVRLSVNGRAHIPRGRTALTAGLRGALMEGPLRHWPCDLSMRGFFVCERH